MKRLLLLLALAPGIACAEPVSAIAAIASIAGSGVATAGIAGLTIAQGAMLAGGVMSLVGNITGDKKLQKFGGLVSLGGGITNAAQSLSGAGAEAAKEATSAAAEGLGQSAVTPAAEVAQQAAATSSAATAEELAGLGANTASDSISQAVTAPSAAAQPGGLVSNAQGAASAATPVAEPSLLDKLAQTAKGAGRFIKDNKELVNLAGGAVKGAMEADAQKERLDAERQYLDERRAQYNASVQGVNVPKNIINPNANPLANRAPQDPMRYIPRRGLVTRAQGV